MLGNELLAVMTLGVPAHWTLDLARPSLNHPHPIQANHASLSILIVVV